LQVWLQDDVGPGPEVVEIGAQGPIASPTPELGDDLRLNLR
jgi:hypothetical protein